MDKKVYLAKRDCFVYFEKVGHYAPALVIDIFKLSFFLYPPCMATHCTHTTEKHITLPTHNTHHTSQRQRRQGQASTSMCCHRRHPTGGDGLRSKGGSNAGHRNIAAAVTAALTQLVRLSTRGGWAGAALAMLYWRALMPQPVQDGAMGDREGTEGATVMGRGRIAGGEENGGEVAVIPSLVGLRQRWTAMMRMTVVADSTKQQPTP